MPYIDKERRLKYLREWKAKNKDKIQQQVRRHQWRAECKRRGVATNIPMPEGWIPLQVAKNAFRRKMPPEPRHYQTWQIERAEKMGIATEAYTKEKWLEFCFMEKQHLSAQARIGRRETVRLNLKKNRSLAQKFAWEYKEKHPCVRCGFSHPAALHFHHLRDKLTDVSKCKSVKAVKIEIEKCDVLCANCHHIEHHEEKRAGKWRELHSGTN